MRIKNIYEANKDGVELSLLTEAVRFGSREKQVLQQYHDMIRIGCEYEFHIDKDQEISEFEEEEMRNEAREIEENEMEDQFGDEIVGLTTFINEIAMIWDDFDTVETAIDDVEEDDSSMMDAGLEAIQDLNMTIADINSNNTIREVYVEFYNAFSRVIPTLLNKTRTHDKSLIAKWMSDNLSDFRIVFDFVEDMDDSSPRLVEGNLITWAQRNNSEWWDEELERRIDHRVELMDPPDRPGDIEQLIDMVVDDLEDSPIWKNIEKVEEDSSVDHGVEVVTYPISLGATVATMNYMFNYIKSVGSTSDNTGMHVNISTTDFQDKDIDMLKVMTLMDSDFFQNNSMSSSTEKAVNKWFERNNMVEVNSKLLTVNSLYNIADGYVQGGVKEMEQRARDVLIKPLKFRGINWSSMFKADGDKRRIEFRFFGGDGYENRQDEIMKDIMFISYVLLASSRKVHNDAHLKGLVKMLDRVAKQKMGESFNDLIAQARKKDTTPRQGELFTTYTGQRHI